ncbi:IS66 family transposase [Nonomuraea sp. NPDC049486]|uniref:IS66 family transposase n=1 Tax=Nonomuraea sp. NPDC049486 TaxID=3155773 RepID=UPI003434CDA3
MPRTPDRRTSYDELASLVVRQMETIEAQRKTIARLEATVERLTARVAELERRQNRNSGNSSLPPSSDTFVRPDKKPPPMSGRKRGRQPGAPGSGLAMVENPDEVEDHVPAGCGGCGQFLSAEDSVGYARRQVRDIPLVTVTVTEHRVHRCRCGGCGAVTSADLPATVAGAPSSYGPKLRALAAYLLVFQHVPVERCAQLIADVTGARVSPGWVSSILAEAATLVTGSVKVIRALLALAHVLHVDETTTRIGAARRWLHVACTTTLTLLGLGERSRQGANSLGVLPEFRGVLVHDSLSLYNGYPHARHQLCGAHLVRELTAAAEDHPGQRWPAQIRWALAQLNKQAIKAREAGLGEIPPERARIYLESFHHGIAVGLSLHPRAPGRKQSPARNLLERLRDRADEVLRFADFPGWVPFTNNTGERALRPVKTQVKISGCHQSEDGAAHWLTVRSYLDSARKHGLSAFEAIHRAFTGNLWMPPVALEA